MISKGQQAFLLESVLDQRPIAGLTHAFYRYPARFSPVFARAAIDVFTEPGDVVIDPFMGGGTTLVEAAAAGRLCAGTDLSALSSFLCRVKTRPLSSTDSASLAKWFHANVPAARIVRKRKGRAPFSDRNLPRNMGDPSTWRITFVLQDLLSHLQSLTAQRQRDFARAVLLNAGQWALDNRRQVPSVGEFRAHILQAADRMLEGASEYALLVRRLPESRHQPYRRVPLVLRCSAADLASIKAVRELPPPKLVLTSPPYPGVHVLYHRWQVEGRRETGAPFWVSGSPDGHFASHYTFGDRQSHSPLEYFRELEACFRGIVPLADESTIFVQLVGFSNPPDQLPTFLSSLRRVGLEEIKLAHMANSRDGRAWRSIPNRKWYNSPSPKNPTAEVVLVHRVRRA